MVCIVTDSAGSRRELSSTCRGAVSSGRPTKASETGGHSVSGDKVSTIDPTSERSPSDVDSGVDMVFLNDVVTEGASYGSVYVITSGPTRRYPSGGFLVFAAIVDIMTISRNGKRPHHQQIILLMTRGKFYTFVLYSIVFTILFIIYNIF